MMIVRQDPDRYGKDLGDVPTTFATRDGRILYSRLIQPSDAESLLAFFERLSSSTRRRRFHTSADNLTEERKREVARDLASVDNHWNGGAVLALDFDEDGKESIVGVARLARLDGQEGSTLGEAAVVVQDDYQGRGVGTELLFRMVLLAKRMRVDKILAEFEPSNEAAIKLFREINLPTEIFASHGETTMYITLPSS